MGLGLALIVAGIAGAAINDEVKHYKKTGEISRSTQTNITKMVGKADLGGKLVDAIAKSILK